MSATGRPAGAGQAGPGPVAAAGPSKRAKGKRKAVRVAEDRNEVHTIPARAPKRTRTDADPIDDDGDSAAAEAAAIAAKNRLGGYSLDSDDEDEEATEVQQSRYELQEDDEHEDLDTTFKDGGVRVTAFNLEEENEDGYFDEAGNYFENKKDADHEGDNWLADAEKYIPGDKEQQTSKSFAAADAPEVKKRDRLELLAGLLRHLHPRESVQKAMRRLGGSLSEPSWKQAKKGGKAAAAAASRPTATAEEEAAFSELTACTDELLGAGEFDVYSYSYEKVAYEIKQLEEAAQAAASAADDSGPKFEYKWSEDALETYGSYSARQMLSWQEQGFFKDGVMVREMKEGKSWYNAKRVDFDLYID
mmetsp:Transcript_29753/g.78053  ORF Transcript_29753/g.78053 Transcript_29753/m.78053 type:complete len:361 (-) Transcript_29753:84-1166(-)